MARYTDSSRGATEEERPNVQSVVGRREVLQEFCAVQLWLPIVAELKSKPNLVRRQRLTGSLQASLRLSPIRRR
jgi:hypothetical protein